MTAEQAQENAKKLKLPLPPWSLTDGIYPDAKGEKPKGLISRFGEEEGLKIYLQLSTELGYGTPERGNYPSLDPTPFLDIIRAQNAPKSGGKSATE